MTQTLSPPAPISLPAEAKRLQAEISTIQANINALSAQNTNVRTSLKALEAQQTKADTDPNADPLALADALILLESRQKGLHVTWDKNLNAIASNNQALAAIQQELEGIQYRQAMASCKAELEALTGSAEWEQMNLLLKQNFAKVLAIKAKHEPQIMGYRAAHSPGRPAPYVSASQSVPQYQLQPGLECDPTQARLTIAPTDISL